MLGVPSHTQLCSTNLWLLTVELLESFRGTSSGVRLSQGQESNLGPSLHARCMWAPELAP